MRTLVAALFLASLLLPAYGAPPTNRAPYAQSQGDITLPWSTAGNPSIATLDAGDQLVPPESYDPDGDTITCLWYQDGGTSPAGYAPNAPVASTACTTTVQMISGTPGAVTRISYRMVLFVDDGNVVGQPSPNYSAGITCSNNAGDYFPERMCSRFWINAVEPTFPPTLATPAFNVVPFQNADLIQDRFASVRITTLAIQDDYQTRSVIATFDGPAFLQVALHKDSPGPQDPTSRPETSFWSGAIPVNDPRWRVGTYQVSIEARDDLNQVAVSDPEAVTYDIVADSADVLGALDLDVVAEGLVTVPFAGRNCAVPNEESTSDTTAGGGGFTSIPAVAGFALGDASTLRLNVAWPYVDPIASPGVPSDIFAGQVTYRSSRPDGPGGVFVGPETKLPSPYAILLPALDFEEQALLIRAEDRRGGVSELCIWLGIDTDAPFWLPDIPDVTYSGIPASIGLYTRDNLRPVATLRIDNMSPFDVPYEATIDGSLNALPEGLESIRMPAFGTGRDAFVTNIAVDPTNVLASTFPCDIVLDLFAPFGEFDAVFTPSTHTVHRMVVYTTSEAGINTYGVDLDNSGAFTPINEPVVRGGIVGYPFLDENRCSSPFTENPEVGYFLTQGPTQLLVWRFTRDWVDDVSDGEHASTSLRIHDISRNRVAEDYTYRYGFGSGGHDEIEVTRTGQFVTLDAVIDAQIVRTGGVLQAQATGVLTTGGECPDDLAEIGQPTNPVLAGDLVCFLAAVKYTTEMEPAPFAFLTIKVKDGSATLISTFAFPQPGVESRVADSGTLLPGTHVLAMSIASLGAEDSNPGNNGAAIPLEVYAGKVVVTGGLGEGTYYIRAQGAGVIRTAGGAATLTATGQIDDTFDLTLNQTVASIEGRFVGTRYEFNVTGENNETRLLYWDPQDRADPVTNEPCDAADAIAAQACRAITVLGTPAAPPPPKKSPGVPLFAVVAALAALGVALRRRR